MTVTLSVQVASLDDLRRVLPRDHELHKLTFLTKSIMDKLVDQHQDIFGVEETHKVLSQVTGETTMYTVPVSEWPRVHAFLLQRLDAAQEDLFKTVSAAA